MTRSELLTYVRDCYSADPDYPWGDENYVLRHDHNRKWFAVGLAVPYPRLGVDRDGIADIIDVKCSPLMMGPYLQLPGILPGYHMNKDHWLTVLLDGSAADDTIKELLEISYEITKGKKQ